MTVIEQYSVPGMKRIKSIHFVGIGGSGMCGIAEVLINQGYEVSGSDLKEGEATLRLRSLGASVSNEHDPKLVESADLVVVSSAISKDNAEVRAARKRRIPVIQRAEMLGELMRYRHGIAIAGTHGKTTTTSMIAEILSLANLSPTFVIGGILNSAGSGAVLGSGKHIVVEADESDQSFLKLKPLSSVITNIDRDHMGTYGHDFDRLKKSFVDFGNNLPFYGSVALCIDDPNVLEIMPFISRRALTYGFDSRAEFRAGEVKIDAKGCWVFRVDRGKSLDSLEITLPVPGFHNVRNALAAIAIATDEGVSDQTIVQALASFSGVGRRFEVSSEIILGGKSLTLVDDYGHHPTEVGAVIDTARKMWPGKRIAMVYQPHRFSRTRDLFDEFVNVLSKVDELVLLDVYDAGESAIDGASSKDLSVSLRNINGSCPLVFSRCEEVISRLQQHSQSADVLIVQGAGNVSRISKALRESDA